MVATRIFICHDLDLQEERQLEVQIFKQLCQKLQSVQAEVVLYAGRASDDGFLAFFYQQVSTCQWFLLFQTESAVRSSSVQSAVSIAQTRVEQKQMQGILRFIAPPSETTEPPPSWSSLRTFGATPDYQRALEELVLALPLSLSQSLQADPVAPPSIALLEATEMASAAPYDQQSFAGVPLIAPAPVAELAPTAPLSAPPVSERVQVDPPGAAFLNPALMSASDRPAKLPLRISRGQILLSTALASVLILSGLLFTLVLPLHASGSHLAGASHTPVSARPGIWPTTNATATASARASATAQAAAAAQATATAQAAAATPQGLYTITTSNAPNVTDPLTGPSSLNWDVLNYSGGGSCGYTGGSYHAIMPQTGAFASCMAEASNYSNFLYQVSMTVLSGSQADGGGLIFRDAGGNALYRLHIGIDGSYDLVTPAQTLTSGSSAAIKAGLNQTNLVAIAAQGSTITIYVNGAVITTLTDTTSSTGKIGLMGVNFTTTAVNVAYSDVQIWQL